MAPIVTVARYIANEAIRCAEIACLSAEMNLKKACCEDSPNQFCGPKLLTTRSLGWKRLFEKDSRNLTPSLSSYGSGNSRSRPRLHA
ncbi:MAG: hypothetical protein DMG39_20270 [Acidobacteria bacterium]|nr:MAG: hypothetical protein DMG39_20270 [Acidobacteriota bacterium]